jgi:hypothetical protein
MAFDAKNLHSVPMIKNLTVRDSACDMRMRTWAKPSEFVVQYERNI